LSGDNVFIKQAAFGTTEHSWMIAAVNTSKATDIHERLKTLDSNQ
jgi:hypothetical protein